jgi:hypothetical protein
MFFFAVFFGDICQLIDQCCLSQRLQIENAAIKEARTPTGDVNERSRGQRAEMELVHDAGWKGVGRWPDMGERKGQRMLGQLCHRRLHAICGC